jgi:formylglycine-generating enzyme required for sulfatase activity
MKPILKSSSLVFLLIFQTVFFYAGTTHAALTCAQIFSEAPKQVEIRDLKAFAQAMTEGMLLQPGQDDLFEVYRKLYFGDPNTSVNDNTLKSVTDILKKHPELQKPHFREYEISTAEKVYETPESLAKYLRSQIQTAGEVRSNLFQIEANLGFWKKVLDYQDPDMPYAIKQMQSKLGKDSPAADKEAYRTAKSTFESAVKKRFETYLKHLISKANRDLLAVLKSDEVDYREKARALFATLRYIQEWMEKEGRNTLAIRQAMVDLVHTVGFGNQATQVLLKSKNALDRIEGLKKVLDERDTFAMELTGENQWHFHELQASLKIDFPTGLSKNENPHQTIQRLEQEVLTGRFITKPKETIRVRSLSIQEAPFRSCLGGSDCSTRSYFSKALDPNYIYFTMTDAGFHSSGHATVVLGKAKNPLSGQMEKVAFLDKLQNVPNQQIPNFLQAISMSLAERGYKLGVPEDVGNHNGLSNLDTIRYFVANEILPKLSQKLTKFVPHPNQYNLENGFSRAYKKLTVKIYEPIAVDGDTEIRPGREYESFVASQSLNKNKLIQDLINLRDSQDPNDVLKYVTSGQVVSQLEKLGLFSVKEFEKSLGKILERQDLPFNIRKQAAFEALLIKAEPNLNKLSLDFKNFDETERTQVSSEIRQWSKSSDKRRKKFADSLTDIWYDALSKGDIKTLEAFVALKLFDINTRDESGFSTLHRAIHMGQKTVVEWLIANPNLDLIYKDDLGLTVVDFARLLGKDEIANLIEKRRPESKSRKRLEVKERNAEKTALYPNGTPIVDFVKIPGGKFRMGDDEKVTVTITKPFEIMSILTTQKMWRDTVNLINLHLPWKYNLNADPSYFKGKMNNPVERVSHKDIENWIRAVNELSILDNPQVQKAMAEIFPGHKKGYYYRLPTEAEWEYVARMRGLSTGDYSHGNTDKNLGKYAWYFGNARSKTHPVGLKKPIMINVKPIYDIHGNVWEWVSDRFDDNLPGGVDPQGPADGPFRVLRGGSWMVTDSYYIRSGARLGILPKLRSEDIGFRLVRTRL